MDDLELRVERLEVQVEGLINSLHTLVETLAVAIGRDDVVLRNDRWTADGVGHVLGERD